MEKCKLRRWRDSSAEKQHDQIGASATNKKNNTSKRTKKKSNVIAILEEQQIGGCLVSIYVVQKPQHLGSG